MVVHANIANLTNLPSGGLSSDAQFNTVGGTNAGDSFSGTDANNNTLIGYDAGTAITTGDNNSIFGHEAGKALTTVNGETYQFISTHADDFLIIGRDLIELIDEEHNNQAIMISFNNVNGITYPQ